MRTWKCAVILWLAFSFGGPLAAQEARGTIVGTVADSTGAVIPGASVEVTNKAMGTKAALTANAVGLFQAPYLIPGRYRVTVECQGFRRFVQDDVEVRVNDRLELIITLELGAVDQLGGPKSPGLSLAYREREAGLTGHAGAENERPLIPKLHVGLPRGEQSRRLYGFVEPRRSWDPHRSIEPLASNPAGGSESASRPTSPHVGRGRNAGVERNQRRFSWRWK